MKKQESERAKAHKKILSLPIRIRHTPYQIQNLTGLTYDGLRFVIFGNKCIKVQTIEHGTTLKIASVTKVSEPNINICQRCIRNNPSHGNKLICDRAVN